MLNEILEVLKEIGVDVISHYQSVCNGHCYYKFYANEAQLVKICKGIENTHAHMKAISVYMKDGRLTYKFSVPLSFSEELLYNLKESKFDFELVS